jgi:hypothetical protein
MLILPATWACDGARNAIDLSGETFALTQVNRHPSLELLDFRAIGLAWIDETTLAVIDRDDQQLVSLDIKSGLQRRGARRGGGPGELEGAFMLLGTGGGGVLVGDMQQRRISEFTSGLGFVRSAPVPGLPIQLLSWDETTVTAIWMRFAMTDNEMRVEPTVGSVDLTNGEAQELFSLFAPGALTPPDSDNPFSPPFIAAVENHAGLILAGQSMEYRIVAFERSGSRRYSMSRPEVDEDYLSAEQKEAERGRRRRAAGRRGPPPPELGRMLEQALDAPRPYFEPSAFNVDPGGDLWVITTRLHADSTEVDVFGSEGDYLTTLVLRDRVLDLAFRDPLVAALVTRTAPEVEEIPGIDLYEIAR